MKNEPLIIERTYDVPVEVLWNAITDKNEMKKWYFDMKEFKAEKDFEFSFEGGTENKKYMHLCVVTEVIPQRKLTHSWRYEGYEGNSFVTWELAPDGKRTKLKLTHAGLETFPKDVSDLARNNFVEGWTEIINKSLLTYLENSTIKS
jgi:uncharacterized protein YndB with AHSA1/START domain